MSRGSFIPSIFTLANLLVGFVSIIYTMNEQYQMAAVMVIFAMVLDGMDGRLARRLQATSNFGKELDSLADLVSFGVAPAVLVYAFKMKEYLGYWALPVAILFALSGAVRLARFNVLNVTTHFIGIPITAAGSLLALFVLISSRLPLYFFPVAMIVLAILMVSNLKVPKY